MFKILILSVLLVVCHTKHFERCPLALELRRQKFPEADLRNWVCLVESESGGDTDATHDNNNGSRDYGLFQINDRYWCSDTDKPGKDCNVTCKDLLTDDITKASICAKKIFKRHGFKAWYAWRDNCENKPLPDISNC